MSTPDNQLFCGARCHRGEEQAMENCKSILLVEDDNSLRNAIEAFLSKNNLYKIKAVSDVLSARAELQTHEYDLVLSDVKMPGGSGFDLLEFVQSQNQTAVFILMTAYGTIEQAVAAMKAGAYDFIVKPFQLTTLENAIRSALSDQETMRHQKTGSEADQFQGGEKSFITKSLKMISLIDNLKKVANSKATVLIQGESGTGKEVLARMIHHYSPRRNKAFVAINCAALPDNLLESELFGHEKGSFTGAIQRQIGKFEVSDGGTILLDEISEMSINMQTKLLRVLQECEIYRIGGNKPIPLNLRVIASTNRDLYRYMKEGHFREDLYYRINVIPIMVPPLRERGNDVLVIAEHYLDEFASQHDRPRLGLDELARYRVLNHPWHGNVRELRNSMERATLVGNFEQIGGDNPEKAPASILESVANNTGNHAFEKISANDSGLPSSEMTLSEIEKRVIFETLRRYGGNRTRTAEKLGISLRTLRNKLKTFKVQEQEGIVI